MVSSLTEITQAYIGENAHLYPVDEMLTELACPVLIGIACNLSAHQLNRLQPVFAQAGVDTSMCWQRLLEKQRIHKWSKDVFDPFGQEPPDYRLEYYNYLLQMMLPDAHCLKDNDRWLKMYTSCSAKSPCRYADLSEAQAMDIFLEVARNAERLICGPPSMKYILQDEQVLAVMCNNIETFHIHNASTRCFDDVLKLLLNLLCKGKLKHLILVSSTFLDTEWDELFKIASGCHFDEISHCLFCGLNKCKDKHNCISDTVPSVVDCRDKSEVGGTSHTELALDLALDLALNLALDFALDLAIDLSLDLALGVESVSGRCSKPSESMLGAKVLTGRSPKHSGSGLGVGSKSDESPKCTKLAFGVESDSIRNFKSASGVECASTGSPSEINLNEGIHKEIESESSSESSDDDDLYSDLLPNYSHSDESSSECSGHKGVESFGFVLDSWGHDCYPCSLNFFLAGVLPEWPDLRRLALPSYACRIPEDCWTHKCMCREMWENVGKLVGSDQLSHLVFTGPRMVAADRFIGSDIVCPKLRYRKTPMRLVDWSGVHEFQVDIELVRDIGSVTSLLAPHLHVYPKEKEKKNPYRDVDAVLARVGNLTNLDLTDFNCSGSCSAVGEQWVLILNSCIHLQCLILNSTWPPKQHKNFKDETAVKLAQSCVSHLRLARLELQGNNLGDGGACAFLWGLLSLANSSKACAPLNYLNLSDTGMEGVDLLAAGQSAVRSSHCLPRGFLRRVRAVGNKLSGRGAQCRSVFAQLSIGLQVETQHADLKAEYVAQM